MPRSNQKWCAHPISHQGARKSGPGALRPRGNRPIDNDLAAFITQEYYQANANVGFALSEGDLLCRTCYETESTRFHTHLAVADAKSRESDGNRSTGLLPVVCGKRKHGRHCRNEIQARTVQRTTKSSIPDTGNCED